MAVSQLPQAPYRQDRRIYPTPIIGDVLFSEVRDCTRIEIPEYGTPHPNSKKWPDHKLVYVKTVDIERDGIFEFFYAAERENQDIYNFSSGYRNVVGNAGGREFRVVQRSYVTLREKFEPTDIEFGAPMMDVPEGKFNDVEYVFFDRQQQPIQEQELNALFVAEVHTYIEKAFLEYKLSYGIQKSEVVPEKFRALIPQTSTEQIIEGLAEQPTLTGSQLSVTEDQINPDIKVVKTVSRADQQTGYALSGKQVTNVLQVADVVETIVPDGTTITTTALTVDGSVESMGNGQSLQRVITAPELFTAKSFATQRPDPVPEKFRVLAPTENTEETVVGTAEMTDLIAGELAASEQQVNVHVKRKSRTKRDVTTLPKSLSQKLTTNEKQIATVIETLQNGDTNDVPSATKDIQSEALGDGTYVVRKTEVPELFTSETFSSQRPDPTPEKFRVLIPSESTEENIIGTALMPTLTTGELESTEQQINKFVKRKRSTKRNITTLPKSLTQKTTTGEKQVATITDTLQNGDTSEAPTATKDIQSEVLGDGTYVVRKTEVPELFTSETFSSQRPDPTPEKFRVLIPSESTEENIIGTALMPTLTTGELESTEQQINKFVKRKRSTKRNITTLPKSLTQKTTTGEKQVATITDTLQNGDTSEAPTATKDIQSEVLGDGTYVVRKIEVPELFTSKVYTTQKPDTIPERFRAEIPTQTEQTNKIGQASQRTLLTNELEKSEQQINKFVYREQTTKRTIPASVALPEVQRAYVEGTVAKVNEKLSTTPTIESGLLVSESQATPIGDGKFVVQTVKVDSWPALKSSDWDPVLNAQVVRTEQFVGPPTSFNEDNTSFRAINKDRALKVVEDAPVTALSSYVMSFPIQVDLQLPNVLKRLEVVWAESTSVGSFNSEFAGSNISLSGSETGSATSSITLKPELIIDIVQPWGSDITATAYYFFMPSSNNSVTESAFLGRLAQVAGKSVSRWPSFKPVSHTLLLQGVSGAVKANVSASASGNQTGYDKTTGSGQEFDIGISLNAVTLPPTIHGAINIVNAQARERTVTANSTVHWFSSGTFPPVYVTSNAAKTVEAKVTPTSLAATTPVDIPKSGSYVVKSSIDPYKWGWVKCAAYVVDATVLA